MTEPNGGRLPGVDVCLNCGAGVAASAYCGACGQRAVDLRIGVRGLVREAASLVSSLDSKVPRTAWALLARPGLVAAEYIAGHRVRWVSPVRVFLGAVALYVLLGAAYTQRLAGGEELLGLAGQAAATAVREGEPAAPAAEEPEPIVTEVQALLDDLQRSMPTIMKVAFLLAAPGMILLLALVELRRRRPLFDHAVTGLYLLSLVALVQLVEQPAGLALGALADLPPLRAHLTANVAINALFLVVLALWLRRVYDDRLAAALGKALVVLMGLEVTIAVGTALISAISPSGSNAGATGASPSRPGSWRTRPTTPSSPPASPMASAMSSRAGKPPSSGSCLPCNRDCAALPVMTRYLLSGFAR